MESGISESHGEVLGVVSATHVILGSNKACEPVPVQPQSASTVQH